MPAYNENVNVKAHAITAGHRRDSAREREQHIATDMLTTGQTRAASGCLDT
jgi:hypothetical protein